MRGIYLKSLSYPYSFGRFIFLELPKGSMEFKPPLEVEKFVKIHLKQL